jgi:hypothetical protein
VNVGASRCQAQKERLELWVFRPWCYSGRSDADAGPAAAAAQGFLNPADRPHTRTVYTACTQETQRHHGIGRDTFARDPTDSIGLKHVFGGQAAAAKTRSPLFELRDIILPTSSPLAPTFPPLPPNHAAQTERKGTHLNYHQLHHPGLVLTTSGRMDPLARPMARRPSE